MIVTLYLIKYIVHVSLLEKPRSCENGVKAHYFKSISQIYGKVYMCGCVLCMYLFCHFLFLLRACTHKAPVTAIGALFAPKCSKEIS